MLILVTTDKNPDVAMEANINHGFPTDKNGVVSNVEITITKNETSDDLFSKMQFMQVVGIAGVGDSFSDYYFITLGDDGYVFERNPRN